jgi:CRISPR-associated protein Cas2
MVITSQVSERVRGFLASCMGEVSPGVYVAPRMTPEVRERIWRVMEEWHTESQGRSVVLIWPDVKEPGGLAVRALGKPRYGLHEVDNVYLVRRPLTAADEAALQAMQKRDARVQGTSKSEPPPAGGTPS